MFGRKLAVTGLLSAFGVAVVAVALGNAAPQPVVDADKTRQHAAQMFPDAPDGVDPVVTGPVSTAFAKQRRDANCDDAKWPNVPVVCYPD